MRVGDLVRCIWQPGSSRHIEGKGCIPMKHTIKGELGVIVDKDFGEYPRYTIIFSQFGGYTHPLMPSAFEVINETS